MNKNRILHASRLNGLSGFFLRYAAVYFTILALEGRDFPFFYALLFYAAAFTVSVLGRGRGQRLIFVIFIQLVLFLLLGTVFIHDYYNISSPLYSLNWYGSFFSMQRSISELFFLFLNIFALGFLWVSGITVSAKKNDYARSCGLLDAGAAVFFIIFLLKMVLRTRAEIVIIDTKLIRLFFVFFIFSLASIILSREFSDTGKTFINSHRGTGAVLLAAVVILSFISVIFLILLPELNSAAQSGFRVLKQASVPAGNILASILRFLFFRKTARTEAAASGSGEGAGEAAYMSGGTEDESTLGSIIIWILGVLSAAAVLIALAVFLWMSVKKLFARTAVKEKAVSGSAFIKLIQLIIKMLPIFFGRLKIFLMKKGKTEKTVESVYSQFLKWGRRGGVPRAENETPFEYNTRLTEVYNFAGQDIELITENFIQSVYAELPPGRNDVDAVVRAFNKLKNPGHFPQRLKVWLKR